MTKRDLIIFFSLAFFWAMSFVFYRIGVPEFGSVAFASLRVVFAGLTMTVFIAINMTYRAEIKAHWKLMLVLGLLTTAVPFTLFAFAAKHINAGVLSVMNASVPMMSGVIAGTFFHDPLSKKQILGLVIGITGVVILMSEHIFVGGQHSEAVPMLMALLACVGYATGANITRNFLSDVSPIAITGGALISATCIMLPFALYYFPYGKVISPNAWFAVICIGVVSTALALIFMNQLIKTIGATRATCITLVIPIFAIILGYILLSEALDVMAMVGSVVILIGTYLSLNLSLRRLSK